MGNFTNALCTIANSTICESLQACKAQHYLVQWRADVPLRNYSLTRKEVINTWKKAQRKLNTHPTAANIEKYRIIRAKARRTIKTRKENPGTDMFPVLTTKRL